MVGRAAELLVIAEALGDDRTGAGLVIAGGPGVGKTRLSREAAATAAGLGWIVRSLSGTAAAQTIPLGAFSQWIDQSAGHPPNAVSAVIDAITASSDGAPVLVVADDAHLLDSQSVFVLHQLARRAAASVIATVRTGTFAAETVGSLWKDGYLRRVDVEPLSRPQCDDLLRAALGGPVHSDTIARMWELTRGNVLFLRELVGQEVDSGRLRLAGGHWRWTGEFEVSPTLVDIVELTIGAVPVPLLEVLDIVALAEPLEVGHLTALVGSEAVEEAERRSLIHISHPSPGGLVRVGHPLYGEARRARTGSLHAARVRGRVVSAMTDATPDVPQPDPVRMALLLLDSDLPPDPNVFHCGALAAFLRLDLPLTERLARAAADAGAGVQAQLLHANALLRLARADEAEAVLDELAESAAPEAGTLAAILRAACMLFSRGRPQESWQIIDDALSCAPDVLIPSLQASRVAQLALAGRPAQAADLAETVNRAMVSALPMMFMASGLTLALGDLGRIKAATEVADEGNQLAADTPQAAYQAVGLNLMHAESLATAGYIPAIRTLAAEALRRWADIPRVPHIVATAIDGLASAAEGDLRAAIDRLGSAIDDVEDLGENRWLGYLLWVPYTQALAQAGRSQEALDARARMAESRHPSFEFLEPARLCAEAWAAAARGKTSEAIKLTRCGADVARAHGQNSREVMCLQAALGFGDSSLRGRLAELAGLVEGPRAMLVERWADALAAGDGDRLLAISADLEDMGDRIAAADTAAQAALAFDRQGRRGSRLSASERATRIITDCAGVTPATRAAATPLPLSNREREIASLVSQGLSNREIAEALTMSVRTVEGHIYRACGKLGFTNRSELGRLVSR